MRSPPIGRGPLPPIGIPSFGMNNGFRVVSPVPMMPQLGHPALSMGFGIPRINLADNYVRVVVNYGPFLEVVEGTPEEIASRLDGRVPGIRERLNLKKKDEAIPTEPENILEDVRKSGTRWFSENGLLVAKNPSRAFAAAGLGQGGGAGGAPVPSAPPASLAPTQSQGVRDESIKEKKFRSANVIVVTNHVPVLSRDKKPVGAIVIFKKSYPGDGTYVVSPYHQIDLDGTLSEKVLLKAAAKSINIASSGYIKLDVEDPTMIHAFDNMVEKGIFNRTYVVFVDKVDIDDHAKKYRESRSATSSEPMSFADMRIIPTNQIPDKENYGRYLPVIDKISSHGQYRIALNAESHNQLKGIIKEYNDKKGILMEIAQKPRPSINTINGVLIIN